MKYVVPTALAALLLLLGSPRPAAAFGTNGRHWDEMPIKYWINPEECPVMPGNLTIEAIVEKAADTWSKVVCADVSFQFMGTTTQTWAPDDMNTIYCVSDPIEWSFGEGAAGATLWLPKEEGDPTMEVDLALNGATLEWKVGGGDALAEGVIDPQGMITHELGHWLGLAHSPRQFATMYFAMLPNAIQAFLDADDKAGLCSLYPSGTKECEEDSDCKGDKFCTAIQGIPVCDEEHDSIGAHCSKDYVNCDEMCWISFFECSQICIFTAADYSEGYCSPLCDTEHDECPPGYLCTEIPEYEIAVCYEDPEYLPPDPEPDPELQPEAAPDVIEYSEVFISYPDLREEEFRSNCDTEANLPAPQDGLGDAAVLEEEQEEEKKDSGGCSAAPRSPATALLLLLALLAALRLRPAFRRPTRGMRS